MNKSAFISDLIFTLFTAFLLTLCIFRYLGVPLITALLLSAVCGLLCTCAIGAYLQGKRKTVLLKRSETANQEKLSLHLCLLPPEKARDIFYTAFAPAENACKAGKNRVETATDVYFFAFCISPVTADQILPVARFATKKNKTLVCLKIDEYALQLCTRLAITVKTGDWSYLFLKERNALPTAYLGEQMGERKRNRLRICFAKNNARRFFTSALFILCLALFSPFPLYYYIFAFFLLLTAVFIRIFGYS